MFIDASDIVTENDKHLRGSAWALENISLGNAATDVLRAAGYLSIDTDDDITMLRLGIRLINAAGAGGLAALSGYYQQAAGQVRDLIEVGFLLDLFRRDPKQINRWRVCDEKARRKNFSASALRDMLNALDGSSEDRRNVAYQLFSRHGTHVTPNAIILMSPNMNTMIGPFPDRDRVVALSFDLARYLAAGATYLISWLEGKDLPHDENTRHYREARVSFLRKLSTFSSRTTSPKS